MSEPSYAAIRRYRRELPDKFHKFPLTSHRDDFLCQQILPTAKRVLEIGAGDQPFQLELVRRGFLGVFKTMDIDRTSLFDYYSVDDIAERFDTVIMREVIEHIPRPMLYSYLTKIYDILEPGGLLLLTTPNPWAATWLFTDYTHISPWPPGDLYGVLRWYGFASVEIRRIIWPSRVSWLKRLYWAVHSRCYDIDFAGSFLAVAKKPSLPSGQAPGAPSTRAETRTSVTTGPCRF